MIFSVPFVLFFTNIYDIIFCNLFITRLELVPLTPRQQTVVYRRLATDAAIGGKENGKKLLGKPDINSARPRGSVRRSNRRPCRCGCGLDSPNSVSTTAEDGLRDPRKNALLRVACSSASITAFGPARQRCECCRIELRRPAASPLLLTVAPSLA